MKFVIGFILIMLVILAEVQKEKMTMLMSNNLVKLAMLLSIVFIFKTKNVVLGVISGLVFLSLLVMTSKPLQEGFNNHGESNSLDDEEHMHVVEKLRSGNRGKSCSKLKLVPYKKNQDKSKDEESETESETESKTESKTNKKKTKPKSKTSRLCVEELLHKGNINSININFDRSSKGKEPVAVCPPGFKGPNKKGDCTARWYDGCGYECHKKKCEAYGGSFSDHDFGGNLNYKCVPSMLSEFGDLEEETVNETITMNASGQVTRGNSTNTNNILKHSHNEYSNVNHKHDDDFKFMKEYTDSKINEISQKIENDTTPANVKTMPTESGRGSQSTAQPASAAGMMASTEEAAAAEEEETRAEQEAAAAEQEEAEAKRKAEEAAAAQRKEEEAEAKRKAEEARLKKEEAERKAEEARFKKEEAERKAQIDTTNMTSFSVLKQALSKSPASSFIFKLISGNTEQGTNVKTIGKYKDEDAYYLQEGGKYCAVEQNNQVNCNRDAAGSWEKFSLEGNADGTGNALKSLKTGKYCAFESGDKIVCNRDAMDSWETLRLEQLTEEPVKPAPVEKGKCPSTHPNPYDGNGTNKGFCCNTNPTSTGNYGTKLDNCYRGQHVKCTNPPCEPADNSMISRNGRCGREGNNKTCPGNQHCSRWSWCGTSAAYKNGQRAFNGPQAK